MFDPRYRDEDEDYYEYRARLLWDADRDNGVFGIELLKFVFLLPENDPSPLEVKIAGDGDCFKWICDYWEYVKWKEHGNECCLSEIGYDGFIDAILDPGNVLEYLLPEGRINGYEDEIDLADRLLALHERYVQKSRNRRIRR